MSVGEQSNGLNLDDEDRLPWLEPAGIEEEPESVSPLRIVGLVVLGLVLLGVIVTGGYWLNNRDRTGSDGDAPLIAAESKNYKIPANASDAVEPTAPALAVPASKPATKPSVSAPVRTGPATRPAVAAAPPEEDNGTLTGPRVQLGAFASRAIAEEVWKKHSSRFDYLAPLEHSVEPVETGGRTLYRLRVGVASQAAATETCGRLRVAGENCMGVR